MNNFELILREKLEDLRDDAYGDFIARGIPGYPREYFLGVRVPEIRRISAEMLMLVFGTKRWSRQLTGRKSGDFNEKLYHEMNNFLDDLPHAYLEYDYVQMDIISEMTDFSECVLEVQKFLPHVHNWAVSDTLNPKVFRKHTNEVLRLSYEWMRSERPFTVRFGMVMLMRYFLGERFAPDYLEEIVQIAERTEREEKWSAEEKYYVRMMVAWFMAAALAKQWEVALEILTSERLPVWIHNKAIQKATESRRISREQKEFLLGLKRKV